MIIIGIIIEAIDEMVFRASKPELNGYENELLNAKTLL